MIKASLNDLLIKYGGPDNPSQQQLENDFSQLAYIFFKDRAPQLIPYLLGFEIVDQEEDGTRAVGMFGVKVVDMYYYVPVFFINNQIKGMDFLYNKNNNLLMPLQPEVIDYVINKDRIELGEPEPKPDELMQDVSTPNFDFLRNPAIKRASKTSKDSIKDIFKLSKEAWCTLQNTIADYMDSDKDMQVAWCGAMSKLMKKSADIKYSNTLINFLEDNGGPKAVRMLANTLQNNYKFANAAAKFYPDVKQLLISNFNEKLAPKKASDKIKVITKDTDTYDIINAEEEKVNKILRDGFIIEDYRGPDEKSEMLDVDYSSSFTSPDKPGNYKLFLNNGRLVDSWILFPKYSENPIIIYNDGKLFTTYTSTKPILVKQTAEENNDKENSELYEKAISFNEIKPGSKYVFIDKDLNSSPIFNVKKVYQINSDKYALEGFINGWDGYRTRWDSYRTGDHVPVPSVIQLKDNISTLKVIGEKLYVPSSWKALEVNEFDTYSYKSIAPGSQADLDEILFKSAFHKLIIENPDKGSDYYIHLDSQQDGPYNYKTASIKLVSHYGFGVDDTEEALKEALNGYKARRLVKFAQMPLVGVSMPPMTYPPPSGSFGDSNVPITEPYESEMTGQMYGLPPPPDSSTPNLGVGGELEREISQLADDAARSGQKTIFDHAVIGGLSKSYDVSNMLDTYLPELIKSLDRLGRILFLFYWKPQELSERYGESDMVDLEDLLRSVYKNYGTLLIKLLQKSIKHNEIPL